MADNDHDSRIYILKLKGQTLLFMSNVVPDPDGYYWNGTVRPVIEELENVSGIAGSAYNKLQGQRARAEWERQAALPNLGIGVLDLTDEASCSQQIGRSWAPAVVMLNYLERDAEPTQAAFAQHLKMTLMAGTEEEKQPHAKLGDDLVRRLQHSPLLDLDRLCTDLGLPEAMRRAVDYAHKTEQPPLPHASNRIGKSIAAAAPSISIPAAARLTPARLDHDQAVLVIRNILQKAPPTTTPLAIHACAAAVPATPSAASPLTAAAPSTATHGALPTTTYHPTFGVSPAIGANPWSTPTTASPSMHHTWGPAPAIPGRVGSQNSADICGPGGYEVPDVGHVSVLPSGCVAGIQLPQSEAIPPLALSGVLLKSAVFPTSPASAFAPAPAPAPVPASFAQGNGNLVNGIGDGGDISSNAHAGADASTPKTSAKPRRRSGLHWTLVSVLLLAMVGLLGVGTYSYSRTGSYDPRVLASSVGGVPKSVLDMYPHIHKRLQGSQAGKWLASQFVPHKSRAPDIQDPFDYCTWHDCTAEADTSGSEDVTSPAQEASEGEASTASVPEAARTMYYSGEELLMAQLGSPQDLPAGNGVAAPHDADVESISDTTTPSWHSGSGEGSSEDGMPASAHDSTQHADDLAAVHVTETAAAGHLSDIQMAGRGADVADSAADNISNAQAESLDGHSRDDTPVPSDADDQQSAQSLAAPLMDSMAGISCHEGAADKEVAAAAAPGHDVGVNLSTVTAASAPAQPGDEAMPIGDAVPGLVKEPEQDVEERTAPLALDDEQSSAASNDTADGPSQGAAELASEPVFILAPDGPLLPQSETEDLVQPSTAPGELGALGSVDTSTGPQASPADPTAAVSTPTTAFESEHAGQELLTEASAAAASTSESGSSSDPSSAPPPADGDAAASGGHIAAEVLVTDMAWQEGMLSGAAEVVSIHVSTIRPPSVGHMPGSAEDSRHPKDVHVVQLEEVHVVQLEHSSSSASLSDYELSAAMNGAKSAPAGHAADVALTPPPAADVQQSAVQGVTQPIAEPGPGPGAHAAADSRPLPQADEQGSGSSPVAADDQHLPAPLDTTIADATTSDVDEQVAGEMLAPVADDALLHPHEVVDATQLDAGQYSFEPGSTPRPRRVGLWSWQTYVYSLGLGVAALFVACMRILARGSPAGLARYSNAGADIDLDDDDEQHGGDEHDDGWPLNFTGRFCDASGGDLQSAGRARRHLAEGAPFIPTQRSCEDTMWESLPQEQDLGPPARNTRAKLRSRDTATPSVAASTAAATKRSKRGRGSARH